MMQPDLHLVYSIENDNIYVDKTYIRQLYLEIVSPNANGLISVTSIYARYIVYTLGI
jgi:hypothetical protein